MVGGRGGGGLPRGTGPLRHGTTGTCPRSTRGHAPTKPWHPSGHGTAGGGGGGAVPRVSGYAKDVLSVRRGRGAPPGVLGGGEARIGTGFTGPPARARPQRARPYGVVRWMQPFLTESRA